MPKLTNGASESFQISPNLFQVGSGCPPSPALCLLYGYDKMQRKNLLIQKLFPNVVSSAEKPMFLKCIFASIHEYQKQLMRENADTDILIQYSEWYSSNGGKPQELNSNIKQTKKTH